MKNNLIIVRGGGDVATGSIQKLHRVGFKVLVLDIEKPTCIRKKVAVSQAIFDGKIQIEDILAEKASEFCQIEEIFDRGNIPVFVDPNVRVLEKLKPLALVDGIIAKKNLGTSKKMAPITVGLGPGFIAGVDCDVVVETNRGHDLGRVIFEGPASANTGNPGNIEGYTTERILRSPADGYLEIIKDIGDVVKKDEVVGKVNGHYLKSNLDGMIRGMINEGVYVNKDMKVGDVDPRVIPRNANTISDKARLIGGGVLEAVLILKRRRKL